MAAARRRNLPFRRLGLRVRVRWPRCGLVLAVLACVLPAAGVAAKGAAAAESGPAAEALARGVEADRAGRLDAAIEAWTAAERQAAAAGDTGTRMEALLRRAEGYQTLGLLGRAAEDLETCRALAAGAGDSRRQAMASGMLGSISLTLGRFDAAERLLRESLDLAERTDQPDVTAATLANLGLLMTVRQDPDGALPWLDRSAALANRLDDPALLATAQINRSRAAIAAGRTEQAAAALDAAGRALGRMPPTPEKARLLVARAVSLLRLQERAARSEPARQRAIYDTLREAIDLAGRFGDKRTLSFAYGHLGRLYEIQRRPDEALEMTRTAVRLAQQAAAPAILYQWHWQTARLLEAAGDTGGAIEAYRRAVASLREIRFSQGQAPDAFGGSFRQTAGPVYVQYADLLLQRARNAGSTEAAQADLRQARSTMELFKTAELEDYFRDDCVASLQEKVVGIDRMPERTAALYPILLPDRTELILTIGDRLQQVTIPAREAEVTETARELRLLLERVATRQYLRPAQRLYDLILRPVEPVLAANGIDTLVFVPDGALRTIPLAALHDGERFVVERYATAVVPGLTLLDPRPIPHQEVDVLLNALTQSVQGFPALPHVAEEVASVQSLFPSEVLIDRRFVIENLQRALASRPYTIVHIASHGELSREAEDSYLLTFDDRLTMDRLERFIKLSRFREEPVELLILSACQTAAGDDRAALGLAGIAIKAGARSAVATLWSVHDQASAELVTAFYERLQDPGPTKAAALRDAQLSLLRDPVYRHPGYWSPFLLIGNWL